MGLYLFETRERMEELDMFHYLNTIKLLMCKRCDILLVLKLWTRLKSLSPLKVFQWVSSFLLFLSFLFFFNCCTSG